MAIHVPKEINKIFKFLSDNHAYNKMFQEKFLAQTLASCSTNEQRALLLLYRIINTQSQPKLEPIAKFFQALNKQKNSLRDFTEFSNFLLKSSNESCLFASLRNMDGWGPKTAALLIRNLALIEQSPILRLQFWRDITVMSDSKTSINLPVDAVILSIFNELKKKIRENDAIDRFPNSINFQTINEYLQTTLKYTRDEILIWDDLWFWGFINQRSTPDGRKYEWNEAKYWSNMSFPKDPAEIRKIQQLSKKFRSLITVDSAQSD